MHCKFGEARVTKKREQNKTNWFVFYAECIVSSRLFAKLQKKRSDSMQSRSIEHSLSLAISFCSI